MHGGSNTKNITRVYLAITNVSRNVVWMHWLDFCRKKYGVLAKSSEGLKTGWIYSLKENK